MPGIREGKGAAEKFVVSPSRDETTLAGKEKLQHKQRAREGADEMLEMRKNTMPSLSPSFALCIGKNGEFPGRLVGAAPVVSVFL